MGAGVVVDVPWHGCWRHYRCTAVVVLAVSSDGNGVGASDVIDARQHEVGLFDAIVSEGFNTKPGQEPLFVYCQVVVLFNKWYVSDGAVTIVDSLMECGPFIGVLSNVWCFVFRHFVV